MANHNGRRTRERRTDRMEFMEKKPYDGLSGIYDFWQEGNDPAAWADFSEKMIRRHCRIRAGDGEGGSLIVADLGCGTGAVSAEMARRGYDVIGIDESGEMLSAAAAREGGSDVRYVCQDITHMELYGTADVMLCFLDTVNHITDIRKLRRFFRLCKQYLNPGGILLFDAATEHYFRDMRGNRTFACTSEDQSVLWENEYCPGRSLSISTVTVFRDSGSGLYRRSDTEIRERFYNEAQFLEIADSCGFQVLQVCAGLSMKKPDPKAQRLFYVLRNSHDEQKEKLAGKGKQNGG